MSKRQVAARITTPNGVFEAGKEVAVFIDGEEKRTVAGTIEAVFTNGTVDVKHQSGLSHLVTMIASVSLREKMKPEVWDKLFPPPNSHLGTPQTDAPQEAGVQREAAKPTVMTIMVLDDCVRLAASSKVKPFVVALKAQTQSRRFDSSLLAWTVAKEERAIAERLACEYFDRVVVAEGEERRQIKPAA